MNELLFHCNLQLNTIFLHSIEINLLSPSESMKHKSGRSPLSATTKQSARSSQFIESIFRTQEQNLFFYFFKGKKKERKCQRFIAAPKAHAARASLAAERVEGAGDVVLRVAREDLQAALGLALQAVERGGDAVPHRHLAGALDAEQEAALVAAQRHARPARLADALAAHRARAHVRNARAPLAAAQLLNVKDLRRARSDERVGRRVAHRLLQLHVRRNAVRRRGHRRPLGVHSARALHTQEQEQGEKIRIEVCHTLHSIHSAYFNGI